MRVLRVSNIWGRLVNYWAFPSYHLEKLVGFLRHTFYSPITWRYLGVWKVCVIRNWSRTTLNVCTSRERAQNKESRPKVIYERGHFEMMDSGSLNLKEKGKKMKGREKIWRSSMTMSQQQNEQWESYLILEWTSLYMTTPQSWKFSSGNNDQML